MWQKNCCILDVFIFLHIKMMATCTKYIELNCFMFSNPHYSGATNTWKWAHKMLRFHGAFASRHILLWTERSLQLQRLYKIWRSCNIGHHICDKTPRIRDRSIGQLCTEVAGLQIEASLVKTNRACLNFKRWTTKFWGVYLWIYFIGAFHLW
jgi:hypothetical protein